MFHLSFIKQFNNILITNKKHFNDSDWVYSLITNIEVHFVGYLRIMKIKLCLYTKLVQVHISCAHLQKRILTLMQKRILAIIQSRKLADNEAELFALMHPV